MRSDGQFKKGHKFIIGGEKGWFKKGFIPHNKGKYIITHCKFCGKEMSYPPSTSKLKVYCSRYCQGLWQRDHLKGANNPNFNPMKSERPSIVVKRSVCWALWRKTVFERDNYQCRNCGAVRIRLHPHHLKSKQVFPDLVYEASNGVTLCYKCHYALHRLLPTNQYAPVAEYPLSALQAQGVNYA